MIKIVEEPIEPEELFKTVLSDQDGAIVSFSGVVRNQTNGTPTNHLVYEAYPEMAEAKMSEIATFAKGRWQVDQISILHRIGTLEIGEISVLIAVSSPHRGEAFAACQYLIDRLKEVVPIWKKEVGQNGEYWVDGPDRSFT
jgi:molybdopterin synthase catalytic subunit